jgi:mannosylglycerate hydrolase
MTEIIVVPHTHWDREWYEPFQRFRLRLVALLDDVFDRMAADPRQRFTLDGQMAAVDDYLEVRPQRRAQVAELVRTGQLSVGPWEILLDEFLCSGENIVRNLERGLRRAEQLGGALPVGYLPDMFGHIAQMPQILAGAGLAHACVFRGVPSRLHQHTFAWESPDGTVIRTEYLPGGYGNAADLTDVPALVAKRALDLAAFLAEWRDDADDDRPMLAMYGTDHAAPAADVADLLAKAAAESGLPLRLGTLAEYFATQPTRTEGLPRIAGELRSHARANILPGVISVRTHLKRAMGGAERAVERHAEPLAALWHDGHPSLRGFLEMAWSRLIECSCHDSVTGCGCDETAQQVAARLAEADQLGRAVVDLAGARLAASVPLDGYAIWNPTPSPRTALVELDVDGGLPGLMAADGSVLPIQVLSDGPSVLADEVFAAQELPKALQRIHGIELYGQEITRWELAGDTLTFFVGRHGDPSFSVSTLAGLLDGSGPWRVRIVAEPRQNVAALIPVPALGHVSVRPAASAGVVGSPVVVSAAAMSNGSLTVSISADGLLDLSTPDGFAASGLGRLVDGGDVGDSYNYAPPASDTLVSVPDATRVSVVAAGPLVGVVLIERDYRWPVSGSLPTPVSATVVPDAAPAPARSAQTTPVTVTTRVELRAGEPFVRLRVGFDNRSSDHRLRLHLPLPLDAVSSFAEGQFAVVERGLTAEGGGGEAPLPTFPANGFVVAGGVAALLTQPTEYEITDGELAITLLRSIGMLSRNRHVLRDEPAGPQLPAPQAQCHGEQTFELALMPVRGDWHRAGVAAAAEAYRHPFVTFAGTGPALLELPAASLGVQVDGEGVVTTSVRDRDGRIEIRFVALQPAPSTAVISAGWPVRAAWLADLRGRPGASLPIGPDGAVRVDLRAFEIATLQLDLER